MRQRLSRQSEGARALSPEASRGDNLVGRNAGDFLGFFGCELVNVLGVLFETMCPLINEGLINKVFFDQDAGDTGSQSGIRTNGRS